MLAFVAIAAALLAITGCRFAIHSRPALRTPFLLYGVGIILLAAAAGCESWLPNSPVCTWLATASIILLIAATSWAAHPHLRFTSSVDEWLDLAFLVGATMFCGWGLVLRPLDSGDRSLVVLSVAVIGAIGLLGLQFVFATSWTPITVMIPAAPIFGIIALGISRESVTRDLTTRVGLAHERWFTLALVGSIAGLLASVRYVPAMSKPWGFANRFRNALITHAGAIPAIVLAGVAVTGRASGQLTALVCLSALALLFIARCMRAYNMIVGLESSVATREALIRLPGQAVGVRTEDDFAAVMAQLAESSAIVLGMSKAEIYLNESTSVASVSEPVAWGLTEAETKLLLVHSNHESVVPDRARADFKPYRLSRDNNSLPVEDHLAWSAACKVEALIIPLHARNRTLGHLELWSPSEPASLSRSQRAMAGDIGSEAGLLIEHSLLALHSRGEIIEAEMLLAVSEVFSRATSLADCLPLVAERLLKRAESDRITISLIDHDASEVFVAADARNLATVEIMLQGKRWPLEIWASYQELAERGSLLALARTDEDVPECIGQLMDLHGAKSYLAIPGFVDNRLMSIVQIMSGTSVLGDSAEIQNIWQSIATQIQLGIDAVTALETSQRRERLETMRRQINESLRDAHTIRESYQKVAEQFRQIPDINGATIVSCNASSPDFVFEATWLDASIPWFPVGAVLSKNESLFLRNIDIESRPRMCWIGQAGISAELQARMEAFNVGSVIAMPLRVEEQMVGAIMINSHQRRPFSPETIELIEQLARTLGLVVQTMGLRQREEEQREEQALKLRMLQAATSETEPAAALLAIAEAGLGYAGAESIGIAFINDAADQLTISADTTIPEWPGVEEIGATWPVESGSILEESLHTLQALASRGDQAGLSTWELTDISVWGAQSWITAPLHVGGRALGLLRVLSRDPEAFDQRRLRLWDEIAQQVSLVISTFKVSQVNQRLTRQQHLTSLINQAGATSSSREETYERLARIGLQLPGVDSSTIFLWHETDGLLEVAHEAVLDESIRTYRAGQRIVPDNWSDDTSAIHPQEVAHLHLSKVDISRQERDFLERIGMGRAAILMLLHDGNVHGVLTLKGRSCEPFPPEALQLAEAVASSAAAVVRNVRSRDEDRRTEHEQIALLRLSRAAPAARTLELLMTETTDLIRELTGAGCAEIYTFVDDNQTRLVAVSNDPLWRNPCSAGATWPTGDWSIEAILQSSPDPIVILDLSDERLSDKMRADFALSGSQSLACMPLTYGDGICGYVAVFSTEPRWFTSEVIESTATVVNQAALAFDHTRTRIAEQRVAEQRAVLLRVSQAAGSSLDLRTVLSEIAAASLGVAQSESCVIELYDPELDELSLDAVSRVNDWVIPDNLLGKRRAFGSWAIDEELRNSGSLVMGSVDDERVTGLMRDDMLKFETNSISAHALTSGGNFIGMYYCFARQLNAYAETDHWVTGEITAHIVSAVQNAQMLEHEHQLASERERLLQISQAATSTLDLREVLREIASATLGLAGAESCQIELVDYERDEFVTEACASVPDWEFNPAEYVGARWPIGAWSVDRDSVEVNAPILISGLEDPRVVGKLADDMISNGTNSILLIPIWLDDRCVSMMNIYSRKRHAFSTAQKTLAHTLATNVANAIHNAQTHDRERQRRKKQEALVRLSAAATSSLDPYAAMATLCTALCDVVDAESAVVGLYLPGRRAFEMVADVTVPDWDFAMEPGTMFTIADYPAFERVLASPESFCIQRGRGDDLYHTYIEEVDVGLETYALVPLWLNDACLGYIGLFDRRPAQFDQAKLEFLDSASQLIALSLSNGLTSRDQQRRAADRAAVVKVGRAAVSDADVSCKAGLIGRACLELHAVEGASIYLWEHERNELVCLVDVGRECMPHQVEPGTRYPISADGPLRDLVELRAPSNLSLADPALHPELREALAILRAQSVAIFPLWADDRLIGLAVFLSRSPHPFDNETITFGQEIATQTSLAIQASRLLDTTRRYAEEQAALLAVNRAVMSASQTSMADVLERISRETMVMMGAECCEIEGLGPDLNSTVIMAQVMDNGWRPESAGPGLELALSDWPITQRVLETREPVILDVDDNMLSSVEQAGLFGFGTMSALIAPMAIAGQPIGIISYFSRSRHVFTPDHARMATELGGLAALAIDRARTHAALAEQATIDGLTGALNYRALSEHLDQHIALADRTEAALSILMVDMNDFKLINDTHGHIAGDAVLRETARFLRQTVRPSDLVGRCGGDEFMIVLPGTDAAGAIGLRDRLVGMAGTNRVSLANGGVVAPSFSIGYAAYPAQAVDRMSLIEVADRSMYQAKLDALGRSTRSVRSLQDDSVIRLAG